jgi:hypothetical protein
MECTLEQIKIHRFADNRSPVGDCELAVDVHSMGAHGIK